MLVRGKDMISIMVVLLVILSASGCLGNTKSDHGWTPSTPSDTPILKTLFESVGQTHKEFYLDSDSTIIITIKSSFNIENTSFRYIGIIPSKELMNWEKHVFNPSLVNFSWIIWNAKDGSYRVHLQKGEYYFVFGGVLPKQKYLLGDTVVVKSYKYLASKIPMEWPDDTNVNLHLSIREAGTVEVYFFSEYEFKVWKEGGTARAYFIEKRATSGVYHISNFLNPGTYYLIFGNSNSGVKTIDYAIYVDHYPNFAVSLEIRRERQ
ncbi:hypothetical protein [Thermococcus gammatolerans]|nr:hypothetical protein [Thermococcus gammatolerans]